MTPQDDDPCLVSTMTESLLPFLPGDNFASVGFFFSTQIESFSERGGGGAKQQSTQQQGTQVFFLLPRCLGSIGLSALQVIKLMSISHGDRSVDLPSLNVEHNYPHLLSELVMKL